MLSYPCSAWRRGVAACLLCLLLPLVPVTGAVGEALNLRHYGIGDGLPQTQVRAIYQDADGYLWMGTFGGLGRYDGRQFKVFTTAEGLISNTIEVISGDASGRLWVGTTSGLCSLEQGATRFTCRADRLLPRVRVQALLPVKDALWIGTDKGLFQLTDGKTRGFTQDDGLPALDIQSLARGRDGKIWIGTANGLAYTSSASVAFVSVPMPEFAGRQVLALLAHAQMLWIGTNTGLFTLRGDKITPAPELPGDWAQDDINALALDTNGMVWAATNGGILQQGADGFRLLTTVHGLMSNINFDVYADREGIVWLGNDDGLSKFIPGPFVGYTEQHGLLHYFVRTINEDPKGRLWLGTREGAQIVPYRDGEWRFDESTTITVADGLIDPRVYSIAYLVSGDVLLATSDGLIQWREGKGVVRVYTRKDGLPTNRTQAIKVEPDGRIWVGTNLGMVILENGKIRPAPNPALAASYVFRIREDALGRLWFGSEDHGLFMLALDGKITQLRAAQGLTDETIWDIASDDKGGVWLGSNGDGLFYISPRGDIKQYTTADGLVDNFVWQILVDRRGRIWSYTNRGISRFDGKTFRNYGLEDGLLHLEGGATGAWQSHDGTLWFASANGLMRYNPENEFINKMPPPVTIEEVTLNGKPVQPGADLPYGARALDFNYAAMSFQSEEQLRYRYRLLGATQQWSDPMPYRPITFGNLGPGDYVFEVLARNPDGIWSTRPARFAFHVLPPFWATWWFGALILLVSGLFIRAAFQIRVRKMQAHRRELEEVVKNRTHELEVANKKLQEASITDPLTGLRNRRFLVEQINADVAQSRRAYIRSTEFLNRDIIFMMIDLDNFKNINDKYGHGAGDRVLKQYAQLIARQIRESDYVVRWGGEEFLIVARQTESTECNVIAERIMKNVRATEFEVDDIGTKLHCTCSIGVSHFPFLRHIPDALNWGQIIDIADIAVYLVKSIGRNGWISIQGTDTAKIENGMEFMLQIKHDLAGIAKSGEVIVSGSFTDPLSGSIEGWEHQDCE